MNEGMNESSMRCFDDSPIKKQGTVEPTVQTGLV